MGHGFGLDSKPMDSAQLHKLDVENSAGADDEKAAEGPKDPNIVDWDGPDDPENPMNWSSSKKIAAISMVSLITMLSPLASTMISPSTASVMAEFNSTNETLGAFITSVYLIGYSFGPLVIAPCSEQWGRAIVYNICNFMFLIFNIACAVAPDLNSLIVFRMFAGIAASCPLTLGSGSIADMIPLEKRGLAMASYIMGPLLGPTFGPLAGGYLAVAKGWRWIFWLISIIGGVVLIGTAFFIRESYAFVILQRKTNRLRKSTGNPHLRSALDTGRTPVELFKFSIFRPIKMLLFSPIVFLMSLYMSVVYGYLYIMFTTFPRVFEGQYGFDVQKVGLTYLGPGVGSFVGLVFCGLLSDRQMKSLTAKNGGQAKPEYRLPAMFVGTLMVPIGLFLYAWTTENKNHFMLPIVGTAFLGAGLFCIFMPVSTYLVDVYTTYAASVTAATIVLRSLLGALLPLAGDSMYNTLGLGWGTSTLGFIAVAFIPMPAVFWFFGERIRKSKFAQVTF
ncbi:MFS general substrate transporter [Pleomassaria siparia CBS 279.74]|uniref:MFS general substrate transporter n=1 Tax=Pleomassaria siparia CBS 279.74 TaxID=1314801 RepID=A0A6G1KQJ4_9PLEO|nr:MFS general substrate transporter [Pleomassaria siparia CBS 279.74]